MSDPGCGCKEGRCPHGVPFDHAWGVPVNRLVLKCAGCDAIMGMVEVAPVYAEQAGATPWCFCSWVCLEKIYAKGEAESKADAREDEAYNRHRSQRRRLREH